MYKCKIRASISTSKFFKVWHFNCKKEVGKNEPKKNHLYVLTRWKLVSKIKKGFTKDSIN